MRKVKGAGSRVKDRVRAVLAMQGRAPTSCRHSRRLMDVMQLYSRTPPALRNPPLINDMRLRLARCLCAALLVAAVPATAAAQDEGGSGREARYAVSIGANVALGGLTGGIGEGLRGGSFWRGFARGAAGGGLVFAGKQVTAARFAGAGLLGRELAAVGGSVVNNAAAGRPPLSRLVLPVGPLRVYAQPGAAEPLRVKVDLAGVVGIGYAATRPGAHLDLVESLSAGAPVFEADDVVGRRAAHLAGVIMTTRHELAREQRLAVAHERVHMAQYDFAFLAWSQPAEQWVADQDATLRGIYRYVDISANAALFGALNVVVPSRQAPWEQEAHLLSGTDADPPRGGSGGIILASP